MKLLKTVVLLLLLIVTPVAAPAQFIFKTLNARYGLSASQINCILKDSRGFMWFGTPSGLYRYDGYVFKLFQCDSQDGSSLPDSYIENLQEALNGDLWIKTPAGYCIYHPQTESFERDVRQVFARLGIKNIPDIIYLDHQKNLWGSLPGKGVICFNMEQQLLYEFGYTDDAIGIPQGNICSFGECKDGAIIVYDDGRLVCCDVMKQQQTVWKNLDIAKRGLRRSKTLHVFADQMDNLWLYGQGTLFVYTKSTRTWDTTIGNQLDLTGLGVDHAVNAMGGDRSGNIWIATSRHGLVRCNVNTRLMEEVKLVSMTSERLARQNMAILSLNIDDTDLLWVGTAKGGVAYMGQNIYKFQANMNGDITALTQDSTGQIWYGTSDDGVIGYDGHLASLKVSAMAYTTDGSLWVGSKQNGLTRIRNGIAQVYSANDSIRKTLLDDHINALCADHAGNLWIATEGGLQVYNPRMDQFANYTHENGKIRTNNITALHYAQRGNRMLIGTSEGLIIMDVSKGHFINLQGNKANTRHFSNNYITQVIEDQRGLIWIGTREGINVFNPENDDLDYLTEKNDLCNNNICGLAEDLNHNIWVTTSNGVSRVVVQRNHEEGTFSYGIYNYSFSDGLQSEEFNPGAILRRADGNVEMGGLFGVNWVRPKSADEIASLPRVMLTQLYIGEEEILTGLSYDGNVVLPQALNESSTIRLRNDQNTFTVKFAAGNYNQSERLQFNYWMENLDDYWHNGDAMKHGVTFTDLPSGTYKLHVKASSTEGALSNQERVLEIIVEQPWYFQWWMLVLYGLIILVTLYLWKQGIDQVRALWKRKNQVIGELVRQREEIKQTSDDLRQPMSRMTSIIMNLAERESTPEEREQLNALHSQMLTVITRVSDMQASLEHPEEKAKKAVQHQIELENHDVLELPELLNDELTSEIQPSQSESPVGKFRVVFIDSNIDFVKFVTARLKYVYDFRPYIDIHKAATDIETMMPDLVVCKQDMDGMTGSELCNNIKMHPKLNRIKFVLVTDSKLTAKEMLNRNITMGADDYLSKPFNLQEAAMRFNKALGLGPIEMVSNLIEGAETRLLEDRNSSMTTATETLEGALEVSANRPIADDDEIKSVSLKIVKAYDNSLTDNNGNFTFGTDSEDSPYSMMSQMDRQLLNSIEQYVQQNMSRGPIDLEEMAGAMGMAMKPFFQKVHDITGKTPAEVVRDLRLKNACILLQRTNINMSELAINVGFATAEHFINLFKERFGISPSEYRMRYRKT